MYVISNMLCFFCTFFIYLCFVSSNDFFAWEEFNSTLHQNAVSGSQYKDSEHVCSASTVLNLDTHTNEKKEHLTYAKMHFYCILSNLKWTYGLVSVYVCVHCSFPGACLITGSMCDFDFVVVVLARPREIYMFSNDVNMCFLYISMCVCVWIVQ